MIGWLRIWLFQRRWRNQNKHNSTRAVDVFCLANVKVGRASYGNLRVVDYGTSSRLVIGDYCSIAGGVTFLLNGEHQTDTLSTFPFMAKSFGGPPEAGSKGDIVIGTDVWIGQNATICSGVHIGQGAIVAAGSVVTKRVNPYEIVGGIPARVLKKRFSDEIVEALLAINLTSVLDKVTHENVRLAYQKVTQKTLAGIVAMIVAPDNITSHVKNVITSPKVEPR